LSPGHLTPVLNFQTFVARTFNARFEFLGPFLFRNFHSYTLGQIAHVITTVQAEIKNVLLMVVIAVDVDQKMPFFKDSNLVLMILCFDNWCLPDIY
jgi:hypothetical protein